ncbi:hypothetical protein KSS87_008856 [Heliosperma pusillum]|nr:hypothetical protein KSS87_008856 [Heliosperma pusillum]
MACNQKKAPQQIPRTNRFLACFGITSKTASASSDKKRNKTGGSESWFKLCMPKINIIIIRRRKGSFDAKTVALKATQSIIKLEATKIRQVKTNQSFITQESNDQQKQSNDDTRGDNQLEEPRSREQRPITTVEKGYGINKVTKESLLGVSIVVITLITMTFWGHLWAIICMSAWLYCVPLLRMFKDGSRPNIMGSLKAKLASKLYKKKAKMDGVVQREYNGIGVS